MRKKIWLFFILLLMLLTTVTGIYSNQPSFRSENGHLCIESATNRNISLNTKGHGYINVNNENLLQIINLAKEAWDVIESFRTNDLPSFEETIKTVVPMLEGPKGLPNRLTSLETQISNSTAVGNVKGKSRAIKNIANLETRLSNLERKVSNLVSLLSVSECLSNPCQNGGTCMDMYNGFQCNCPQNWQGRFCELDVDECMRYSHTDLGCQNGAECKNTPGSYECLCAPNWYGLHCNKKKNDCSMSSASELCGNGVCINQMSIVGYTCICDQGWTTEEQGPACTKDVDECKENSHTCSADPLVECKNTRGSFTCANCPIGFVGDGFVCMDVDECLINNGGCSVNPRVQCINTRGSFKCESCPPGYSGDGFNCVYMTGGACAINNGGCHSNADCSVYAERSILCTCRHGYTGSGVGFNGCLLITPDMNHPCESDPCGSHGSCIELANKTFSCICNSGYTGRTCNSLLEDPCFINPCQNNGVCEAIHESQDFICNCLPGYFGQLCNSVRELCGGYFHESNGTIRYPESNKTSTYMGDLNCLWVIDVDPPNIILLSFSWIDIEKSEITSDCLFAWVEIKIDDDYDERSLGKFCGKNLPIKNNITTESSTVMIHFHSDRTRNFGGFQLDYTTTRPVCGGEINIDSVVKHGSLSFPSSSGKYRPNLNCYWILNALPGKIIKFNFYSLELEKHRNCSYDYLEIRDGFAQNSPILAKLCDTTLPAPILTTGSHANVHFHSDSMNEENGFKMTYFVEDGIHGCGGIYTSPSGKISSPKDLLSGANTYLDNLNCEWHIRMPLNQKMVLKFVKQFNIESSDNCTLDFLEIRDGPNVNSPLIGRYCGSTRFDDTIITNSNEVTIFFKSDFASTAEGFTISYEILCGGTFRDSKGIIESPFYPNLYPQNKVCIYIIEQPFGKAIQLSILDMEIEDISYPNCIHDSLEIRDGDNENSTKIALLCGSIDKIPELSYLSTHNYLWLKFSTDGSKNSKGFRANYSTIDIACGGILKNSSGVIKSSKHSEEYLHNQLCKWIISVNESSYIQITWLSFSLENQASCNNDYVEIYDNSISGNASKIARYCGTKVPPVLTSIGNQLTILFKTDHSVSLDGFMLSYTALNKAEACGGNFFTTEGLIISPNYPDNYPNHMECIWIITVPISNQIELNITQFILEESRNCRLDFLEIRNGGYQTSPLIGKYCGKKFSSIISSMGNSLYIKFVSDGSKQLKGFFIQWYTVTKGCGGTLSSGVGHIVSPNYPLPVQETLECFYKIVVAKGNKIKLNIVDLELTTETYPGMLCKEDFLEFFDGGNSASRSIGIFCSDNRSLSIVYSSSNQMYIKFRSSGLSKGRGFSLTYTTDCNVTLKGYQGAIVMNKQEEIKNTKCAWTIVAPKGNKIIITFTSFQVSHNYIRSRIYNRERLGHFRRVPIFEDSNANNPYNPNRHSLYNEFETRSLYDLNTPRINISEGSDMNKLNTQLWLYNIDETPSVINSTKNIVRINYIRNHDRYWRLSDSFRIEWIVSGCGGRLVRPQGEFTSPGYPKSYPVNTTCEWNIIFDYGYTIQIMIEEFWLEQSRDCTSDFLAIYNGEDDSGSELLRVCNKQTQPIIVTSSGNEAFVRFQSDELSSRKGFKAKYEVVVSKCGGMYTAPRGIIHSSNYPQNYDSNSSCMWYIEIAETHLINLTFIDFSTRTYPAGDSDRVLVYDGDIHGQLLLNHSGNVLPPTIISSSNKLLIHFEVGKHELRAKGFQAIYSTACGFKLVTSDSGIITSEASQSHQCSWTIISNTSESRVTLIFTQIDFFPNVFTHLSNQSEVCSGNEGSYIRILDGSDLDAPEITKLCVSGQSPSPIVSNGPAMHIQFTDATSGANSFTARYSVRSNACGGTYDLTRGTISSPNYPNNYFRDSECVWTLKSSKGHRIALNFINFELEEDEFCNEDYVEVRERDSVGPVLGIFCGSNLPTNTTSGFSLWVKFRSDSFGSAKGFTANFKYESENYITLQSGEIASPMYPKMYRGFQNDEVYSWTINVDEGKIIEIILKEFVCTTKLHSLKIYDGSSTDAIILYEANFYNENVPENPIISTSNIIYISVDVGLSLGGITFLLSWMQIDKPNIPVMLYPEYETIHKKSSYDYYLSLNTNSSVIITSPGYPNGYEPNLNVTWFIHTDSYNHIEIEFLDVKLQTSYYAAFFGNNEVSKNCFNDFIVVKTVDPDTGKPYVLKYICTNSGSSSDSIVVGKQIIILSFMTNNVISGLGFKAKAQLKCGGDLREPRGNIYVSSITTSIATHRMCFWNITVRPGRTIQVKFITLEMNSMNSFACEPSYVLLKNGINDDSPILEKGKYCNNTNLTQLHTTENKLQVQIQFMFRDVIQIFYEESSVNCGGNIYLNDIYNITQITSPSYPKAPPPHVECIWIVEAPAGERIVATIEELDLHHDPNCQKEYIEFRDGAVRFSPLLTSVCHLIFVPNIETKDNYLYIKYFTDLSTPNNGFKLNVTIDVYFLKEKKSGNRGIENRGPQFCCSKFECNGLPIALEKTILNGASVLSKCGGTRRNQGVITSPNYPGSYELIGDCEYKIIVNHKARVVLDFKKVDLKRRYIGISELSSYNDTYDDSLTIYDVDLFNGTKLMIARIYGSDLPSDKIKSSGCELIIKFTSHFTNERFYVKNKQPQFLINYWNEPNDCQKSYEVESGEIVSPQFSNYVSNRGIYCQYTIKVPSGRRITAKLMKGKSIAIPCDDLKPFTSKEILKVSQDLNVWGPESCIDPVSDSTFNVYESNSNKMMIGYYVLLLRGNEIGFRIKFSSDKPSLCGGKIDASINGIVDIPGNMTKYHCVWIFTNTNGTFVIVARFKIKENRLNCTSNHLLVATSGYKTLLKNYCPVSNENDTFIIQSPLPITKVKVVGSSKTIKFAATFDYYINSCGGIIKGQKVIITSPNYPRNYQNITNCVWLVKLQEGSAVSISFNDIDLESTCDFNYVKFHDGPSPESPVLGKFCGDMLPETLTAISNEIWVVFSSDRGINKKGFNVTLESITTVECGQVHVSETGVISTRDYPKLYPNNYECEWTISLLPGNMVNLQFIERFSLEQSINCTKDYIQIFDYVNGNWVQIGNRLCGRQMPPDFNSSETKLKLRIRTDANIQSDGFKVKWKNVCGGLFTDGPGKIISPNYPKNYMDNLKCNYTISSPSKSIKLVFKYFELEGSKCQYDNLTIYNNPNNLVDKSKKVIGTYCGTNIPSTMMLLNSAVIIFNTDYSNVYRGFEIYFETIGCGGEIITPGIITSPVNYINEYGFVTDLNEYANNLNCTWIIRAPPEQVIQLVFSKFRLEYSIDDSNYDENVCYNDYVNAFDGPDIKNSNLLGVFCGNLDNNLPTIKSKTNIMYVQFITDTSRVAEGFVGEISFTYGESHGCGGTIRLNKSLSYENQYESYILKAPSIPIKTPLNCGWLILVKESYVVQIEVTKYTEVPNCSLNTTDCKCSSIQFLDGPSYTSTIIHKYCSENGNNPIETSSGKEAFIQYTLSETDVNVNFEIKITAVISNCGPKKLFVTDQTKILASHNYSSSTDIFSCSWIFELNPKAPVLMLHFSDLEFGNSNDCLFDYLELSYTQWMKMPSNSLRLCNNSRELDFVSRVTPFSKLVMHVVKQQIKFRLEYKSTKCQTTYDKRNGQISFEGMGDVECKFTIDVKQPNLTISVYFSSYIYFGADNYLKVFDGPNTTSTVLNTLNNDFEIIPSPLFSTGSSLTMILKTRQYWYHKSSFLELVYTSTDQGRGCGGRLYNTFGSVTSPLYPLTYRKNSVCGWDIVVPRPHAIGIAFKVFNLGSRSRCNSDYVELFNVDQTLGKRSFIAKYCGEDSPAYHISTTGAVFIKHTSSIHNQGSGWVLNYKLHPNSN